MTQTDTEEAPDPRTPSADEWLAVQASPQFQDLRNRLRRFVFPMTALFLIWYLQLCAARRLRARLHGDTRSSATSTSVCCSASGQFVSTFLITGLYVRFANRELDPRAAAIRDELEGGQA